VNPYPGIIGTKLGMTQFFTENGSVVQCTAIHANCRLVGKRTQAKDGYSALILGLGEAKAKHTSKALRTSFEKREQTTPKHVQELRATAEAVEAAELGQVLKLDEIFTEGQMVDVRSRSQGKGFAGVMKKHNFKGGKASHGVHEVKRHGGSIGMATTPGRVWPGKKMAGQEGNKIVSVLNQRIAKIIPEKQLLLIEGSVPGAKNGIVRVQGAVKKRGGK
jgi:large subunit ribosomal protein L3